MKSTPNNIKDFYDMGMTTSNNIAFSGGGEKATFRFSYTNMMQNGMVPNTSLDRNTLNGSSTLNLTSKLSASFSVNYIKTNSDNMPTGGYANENPVQQMIWAGRQVDFEQLRDYENLPISMDGTASAGTPLNWNTQFQNNPYWVQDNNLNKLNKDRLIGNVQLNYKFTDWLSAKVSTGTDYWASVSTYQKAHGSNEYKEGLYREIFRTWYETNSNMLLMFNKNITKDIGFTLNLGGNQMKQVYKRVEGEAAQLELKGVYNLSNVKSGVTPTLTNRLEERRINSVFYNGGLSFKNFLYFEFNGRNDWSSVLPADNNSFFYP